VRTIVGVMGSGDDDDRDALALAYEVGGAIAREGWVLLNGGHACGVMEASARGAHEAGGLVVGVLPEADTSKMSRFVDIPIRTGLGHARNMVNVLSSDVVVALPGRAGTVSEVALALAGGKTVIALRFDLGVAFEEYRDSGQLRRAESVEQAVGMARDIIGGTP
jgi:uncharacterized protein (TIGR00725 family)